MEEFRASPEARIAGLESELAGVRGQEQLRRELQNIEVFVRKLQTKADNGAGVSTYSSLCTSACFSSASTICADNVLPATLTNDPELAGVFATLHRRGVEVLGEEGLMDAIVEQARANPPVKPFTGR